MVATACGINSFNNELIVVLAEIVVIKMLIMYNAKSVHNW